jgi:metal-sulfur cluster biosynthetic enzyme/ribosomal protein L22
LTLAAEWHVDEPQLRIAESDGRTALGAIVGRPVISARARLRFGPGRTCEPIARLLDRAIVQAEGAGLDPELLVVAGGSVQAAEDIIRVRRKAHGVADWIHSPTCRVRITLQPAGLHATIRPDMSPPHGSVPPGPVPPVPPGPVLPVPPGPVLPVPPGPVPPAPALAPDSPAGSDGGRAAAVREALSEVIDPDLGVNIVDLGFVRAVTIEERTAVITMTLTSAACPLTGVMEDQIRTELASLGDLDGFEVDWQWIPAWRPADITDSGREQLHAIGFTI